MSNFPILYDLRFAETIVAPPEAFLRARSFIGSFTAIICWMETIAAVDDDVSHRAELLMHLDAFYLSGATRLRAHVTTIRCWGSLFLDRSKIIFRSGLPTGGLTLTYVPTSSWTPRRSADIRRTSTERRAVARKWATREARGILSGRSSGFLTFNPLPLKRANLLSQLL